MLSPDWSYLENTVDPDQLASNEAIWSGSTVFSNPIENKIHAYIWNAAVQYDKDRGRE